MNTHANQFLKIIGLGSPFGDDQLGKIITERLKNEFYNLEIFYLDRPGARLLEYLNNTQFIILIDAVVSNQKIGTIHCLQNNEIDEFHSVLSSHGFGLSQTIALGRSLNQLPKEMYFFGIEVDPNNKSIKLSNALNAKVGMFTTIIKNKIHGLINSRES